MSYRAMVVLATGAEEMELIIPIDVLRRAGISVTVAGLHGEGPVKCSRNVLVSADTSFEDAIKTGPFDAVILPGGAIGSQNLIKSQLLGSFLREQEESGRIVAAICAGPLALKAHKVGIGKRLTSYPTTREEMSQGGIYQFCEERVVIDGKLVTSQGPATAFDFALALVELLQGKHVRDTIARGLLVF